MNIKFQVERCNSSRRSTTVEKEAVGSPFPDQQSAEFHVAELLVDYPDDLMGPGYWYEITKRYLP